MIPRDYRWRGAPGGEHDFYRVGSPRNETFRRKCRMWFLQRGTNIHTHTHTQRTWGHEWTWYPGRPRNHSGTPVYLIDMMPVKCKVNTNIYTSLWSDAFLTAAFLCGLLIQPFVSYVFTSASTSDKQLAAVHLTDTDATTNNGFWILHSPFNW